MKINKKILLATCGLGLTAVVAVPFLASCSQGASINLNQYDFIVNNEKYRLTSSNVEKEVDGKWVSYNFNPNGNYSKEEIAKPEFINNQKESVKQNIYFQVSTYLYNVMNSYFNYLTRVPQKGDVKNGSKNKLTELTYDKTTREFEVAYGLGTGEGKDTYRLKIKSINFNLDETKIWPAGDAWSYDKELANKDIKELVQVSNINIILDYYKISGNTSFDYVDLKEVQNTNYKSYWKNFTFDGTNIVPETEEFKISLKDSLFFEVKPGYKEVKEGETTKYKADGTVTIIGIDNNNVGDYYNWPFAFANTATSSDIIQKIKDQNDINNKIKDVLNLANEDENEYNKWFTNPENQQAKIFPASLITISKNV